MTIKDNVERRIITTNEAALAGGIKPKCAYCLSPHLMMGQVKATAGTGLYVQCPKCKRWQLVPLGSR